MDLWFRGVEYNELRVLERMADLVLAKGGHVKFTDNGKVFAEKDGKMLIYTRGFNEQIDDLKKKIRSAERHLERAGENAGEVLHSKYVELETLKLAKATAPVINSRFVSQYTKDMEGITFTLPSADRFTASGDYASDLYSFSFADNPYAEDLYKRIPLDDDNAYVGEFLSDALIPERGLKPYFVDDMWTGCAKESTIDFAAEEILKLLVTKPESRRYLATKRKRVENTYTDGWHYETVNVPNNTVHKIDF